MLARAELPNLAKIRAGGNYTRLKTTYPAQTPVAWSSFATGTNPGGHGIFDFISRDPETYLPYVALTLFEKPKSIFSQPHVVNRRMLAGVGVPDLRGSQSKGTFYTQDKAATAQENEQLVILDSGIELTTRVIGPRNTRQSPPADSSCEIRLRVDKAARKLVIRTGGVPTLLEIPARGWSEWVRLKFKVSMLQSVSGIVRFYVRQLEPHLEFYASAVNFDPAAPMFRVSSPGDYARELF